MLNALNSFDHSLFLCIHHFRNGFLDVLMPVISDRFTWIPLYALLLFFIWKRFGKQVIMIAVTVGVMILVSDQGANLIKNSVKRYRPCHDAQLVNENVITPAGCGGEYGFFSGHAANSAALALFLCLLSGASSGFAPSANRKWWLLLFPWMMIVDWSRIYMGVHFPLDVLCGMLYGFLCGILFYILYQKVIPVLR